MGADTVEPWADNPSCPKPGCRGPGVTRAFAPRPECYDPADPALLVCCACGDSWRGSPEEVERAQAADAAWEAEMQRGR